MQYYDLVEFTVEDTLADLQKHNISKMVLSPQRWSACRITTDLSWSVVKFDKSQQASIPDDRQGVYTFVVKPEIANHPECSYLLYVGKTERQNLRRRFLQYFDEPNNPKGREPVKLMVRLWQQHLWFCYAPVSNVDEIDTIEESLIDAFVPPINQKYPGQLGRAMRAWQ